MKQITSKPKVKLWQSVEVVGVGCSVHRDGLGDICTYKKEYCSFSEWYEKRKCKYVDVFAVKCRICGETCEDRTCRYKHKLMLETPEIVAFELETFVEMDYGYGYTVSSIVVFDKFGEKGGRFAVPVSDYCKGWLKRTLAHIKKHGFAAKKDLCRDE